MNGDIPMVVGICVALIAVGWWLRAWVAADPYRPVDEDWTATVDRCAGGSGRGCGPGPEDDTDPSLPVLYTAEQARAWDARPADGGAPWPPA